MKPLFVVLLLVSLAGNAALALIALRQPATAQPAVAAASAAASVPATSSTPAASPAPAAAPAKWQSLQVGRDLHGLVANLRAAGFPPSVIRAMVRQLVTEQQDRSAIDQLPFWKQNASNAEYLAAQQALSTKSKETLEALLGPDARPSASLDAATRARRYGNLSDDKIDRIEALNQEYGELRAQMYAQRRSGDPQGIMAAQNAVEEERRAEMATFLTPAEQEQYEMRTGTASTRVAANLKDIEVNEQEFAELFRAQKAFEAADPARTGTVDATAMAKRFQAQDTLNEQARTTLGEDRFYTYLKSSDPSYARATQVLAAFPSVTLAQTYELVRLEREYQGTSMTMARNAAGNPMAAAATFTTMRQEYQNKVNALIGEEAGKAFVQRNRAGTVTTTTVVPPRG